MRKILIVMMLLIAAMPAMAEKGIVLDANNQVVYKFDLPDLTGTTTDADNITYTWTEPNRPQLMPGQYIVSVKTTEQVNAVLKGATYNPATKAFTNPIPVTPAYEEVEIQAKPSAVDPNVLILSGAGITSAYLIARRKKAA